MEGECAVRLVRQDPGRLDPAAQSASSVLMEVCFVASSIRKARLADVPMMVALSEQRRLQYQSYQPLFWRKAADSREKQSPFLAQQLSRENVIALVHQRAEIIDGFVLATLVPSPPVYDAGLTCVIDDYCVLDDDWDETGKPLLDVVTELVKERGAVQTVVVCGHLDEAKRAMLLTAGHTIASEWWVKPIR